MNRTQKSLDRIEAAVKALAESRRPAAPAELTFVISGLPKSDVDMSAIQDDRVVSRGLPAAWYML